MTGPTKRELEQRIDELEGDRLTEWGRELAAAAGLDDPPQSDVEALRRYMKRADAAEGDG